MSAGELRTEGFPWRKLLRYPPAVIGAVTLIAIIVVAIFPTLVTPHDPLEQSLLKRRLPPMWLEGGRPEHPLGTDNLGRDVLARIVYGTRISLVVGISSVVISAVLGTTMGLVAGYFGGRIDRIVQRLGDIQLAFPFVLLSIAVIAVLGSSTVNLILVFGIANWVFYARPVRGAVLTLRDQEFIEAAVALGHSQWRIIFKHILPNVLAPVIVITTLSLGNVIITESSLSFLGLGVPPPTPSWGRMLSEGRNYLATAWWIATFPGVAIMVTVVAINLLGDALRDLFDPRLRTDA